MEILKFLFEKFIKPFNGIVIMVIGVIVLNIPGLLPIGMIIALVGVIILIKQLITEFGSFFRNLFNK